jgi:hypothetical protein
MTFFNDGAFGVRVIQFQCFDSDVNFEALEVGSTSYVLTL